MTFLQIQDLEVRYGRVLALQNVSLELSRGQTLAVLGRNGAGKSSLLNAIAGSVRPSNGRILWQGQDMTFKTADQCVRQGIALVPEGRRIFPDLTVRENLRLGGFTLNKNDFRTAIANVFDLFPLLLERAESLAGGLSGGQRQMLAIGRALMTGASLLLLDEPSLGLAPLIIDEVYAQLAKLREQGLTMILVEQQVQRALRFADKAMVLNLGQITLQEKPELLLKDTRLIDAYMGKVAA
jgi:branched-chain amino acid transport system ATP-binding protein